MTAEQIAVFGIIAGALALFVWDRWRYDVVAVAALVAAVLVGVVPSDQAFSGFADPAVVTVAAVLVISRAIRTSGVLDALVRRLAPMMKGPDAQVGVLVALVTGFSAFMNNVGALALFLPVAIAASRRTGRPASELLMPLSFGSLLGGLVTLIGTPPNILIAGVRRDYTGEPFRMFDFTPVGLGIAAAGVLLLVFGWRLIPRGRRGALPPEERFRIEDYIAEARLPAGSDYVGRTAGDLESAGDADVAVVGIIRDEFRRLVPSGLTELRAGDVLVLESDPGALKRVIDKAGLELVGSGEIGTEALSSDEIGVVEAVVLAESELIRRSPAELRLRSRFGVNLLAVRRPGRRMRQRLSRVRLEEGDVIVLQGHIERMPETLEILGCLPLAERNLQLGRPHRAVAPIAILAAAVAAASLDLVPVQIGFTAAVLTIALLRLLTLKEIYEAVDWPVVVLLGGLIPVTGALQATGGTEVVAGWIALVAADLAAPLVLGTVMVATMLVTPVLNNAATVLVMAPVAADLADRLGFALDPFLMAVAIGASCDFLTPIGHQSNTLVMGPGGYKFGDYWRLGLPLSILVVILGVPLIMLVWPMR